VNALSGVDGSGKSTQARALQQLLAQLGHEAEIAWTPLASDPWIGRLARPVKRALGRLRSLRVDDDVAPEVPGGLVPNPGSRLRERSRAVNWAWAALVAFANGRSHRRLARRHAHAGKVVIFDRYVLDSLVRIRFLYGERPRFRLQRALVRALSPRPAVAVLLDVPAEVSLARKDDRWTAAELERQVALYRAEHAAAGVLRLDGTRPYEELRAELAELAWRALP
jgi:thymidylate kinase